MRSFLALGAVGISAALLAPACGSDDKVNNVPYQGRPGGEGGEGATGAQPSGGKAPVEGGSAGSGGSGVSPGGTGGSPDVDLGGAGAGGAPSQGNAGEPAIGGEGGSGSGGESGSGSGGEGGSGEGPSGNVIYASFGTKLVWLEPDTGKLHEVGDMRSEQGNVTYSEVVFAYGNVPGEAWIVTPRYDATADRPAPELGKLNLCSGVVSELGTLTRTTPVLTALEGLAMRPNGTWYVSTGAFPAGASQYLSNKIGTLNVTTRAITDLSATVVSVQNDMDSMVFVGDVLYGIDVATGNSRIDLVTVNLTTGATTSVATPTFGGGTATPLRIAYDVSRSKAYSWRSSDRNLLELSLVNGTATALGETHAITVYPSEVVQGFTVAPVCP